MSDPLTDHPVNIEIDRDLHYDVKRLARKRGLNLPDYYRELLLEYADGPIPEVPAKPAQPPRSGVRFIVREEQWRRAIARRDAEGYVALGEALEPLVRKDLDEAKREAAQ